MRYVLIAEADSKRVRVGDIQVDHLCFAPGACKDIRCWFEYHLLAVAIALTLVIAGGGILSIDRSMAAPREGYR